MDEVAMIREVDPAQAEAILCVRLFVPGVTEGGEDRFYLTRTPPRRRRVVESVTNADGSVTTVSTTTFEESGVAHCNYADGRTADGRGCWSGKTVYLVGRSANEVVVHLSMYWTARDGSRGNLEEELVVPWFEAVRANLDGGTWVTAEIVPIQAVNHSA